MKSAEEGKHIFINKQFGYGVCILSLCKEELHYQICSVVVVAATKNIYTC